MSYDHEEMKAIQARVDLGGFVTREEAEAVVRSVSRVCKGPIKPGKEAEFAELRAAVGVAGGLERGYSIAELDAMNRVPCGSDFNDVVCEYPFDGKEHDVRCPDCKQPISFRSPAFKLKD